MNEETKLRDHSVAETERFPILFVFELATSIGRHSMYTCIDINN